MSRFCFKTDKNVKKGLCIFCPDYRRNKCTTPEMEFQRQDREGGYELYYPIQEIINKVAGILMLSTKKIVEILNENYNLKIDRTLLFKYERIGLLKKKQKVGGGRAKGVKTYWDKKTPNRIYYINKMIRDRYTLKDIKEYNDVLYNKQEKLKNYKYKKNKNGIWFISIAEQFDDPVKVMGFYSFFNYMAELESGIKDINVLYDGLKQEIITFDSTPEKNLAYAIYSPKNPKSKFIIIIFKKRGVRTIETELLPEFLL